MDKNVLLLTQKKICLSSTILELLERLLFRSKMPSKKDLRIMKVRDLSLYNRSFALYNENVIFTVHEQKKGICSALTIIFISLVIMT